MKKISMVTIEDIRVARVKSESGPSGAASAFDKIESRMASLKGRKMYGVIYPKTEDYFACVKIDEQYPGDMGFENGIIPGGKYARDKIENWESRVHEICSSFERLGKECIKAGYGIDANRPNIEFYRSQKELIIMLPIV